MNALGPPKAKRAPAKSALPKLRLRRAYCVCSFLQGRRMALRRCVSCDTPVTDRNLGGFDGRSALTGSLWCYQCADYALQLILRFADGKGNE
jgi:hypothetical protein